MSRYLLLGLLLVMGGLTATILSFMLPRAVKESEVLLTTSPPRPSLLAPTPGAGQPVTTTLRARDIADAAAAYQFVATIPATWHAEAVEEIEAINIFDPRAPGATNLDKSQIFIRYFRATDFLTLTTVTIHAREETTITGRPAVRYDIEKKAGIATFSAQPSWRNERHTVTDIQVDDNTPSVFYVIARRPDLDQNQYERFLQSLRVTADTPALVEPVIDTKTRVTKKPFGIFVTPANSPVQPERFTGYHTAIDIEYDDVQADVPVRAVASGTVVVARTADGYGGVVALQHTLQGEPVVAIYGHLDPARLPTTDAAVTAGQQIGILGRGLSHETDGERKHLHFGLLPGTTADIRGYVQNESELSAWRDPLTYFN